MFQKGEKNENIYLEYLGKVMEGDISETFTGRVIALWNLKIGLKDRLVTRVLKQQVQTNDKPQGVKQRTKESKADHSNDTVCSDSVCVEWVQFYSE